MELGVLLYAAILHFSQWRNNQLPLQTLQCREPTRVWGLVCNPPPKFYDATMWLTVSITRLPVNIQFD